MIWQAKARRDYHCDNCGGLIKKGDNRVVTGQKALTHTMIDRNLHVWCFEAAKEILGDHPKEYIAEYITNTSHIEGVYSSGGVWVKVWILKAIAKESEGFS